MTQFMMVKGNIVQKFGYKTDPTDKKTTVLHNGIDIEAFIGEVIKAPIDVIVMDVYEHDKGGLTLILADAEKKMRIGLCHLYRVNVKINQSVKKGQNIAMVGETGGANEPHVHISLKKNGNWCGRNYKNGVFVDPTEILYL